MDCLASMDCLPDDILVQILSFLPTKQAASTSLLSKRWRTLFALCPNLDFDYPILWLPEETYIERIVRLFGEMNNKKSFCDFVDSLLAFQDGKHIEKFSLIYTESFKDDHEVDRWVCNALKHGVSELHLHIESFNCRFYPSEIFTSTTLVKLSLETRFGFPELVCPRLPSDTCLPKLKVLLLDSVHFVGLSAVFLAACPALEDLTIYEKYYHSYVISSETIKKLSVTIDSNCYFDTLAIISLDTPSLVHLHYSDYPRRESSRCRFESLAKATLDLRFLEDDTRLAQNDADVTGLINAIRNVETLHLTTSAVEVMSVCCKGGLPVFNNLVELQFSSSKKGWRVVLPLLLERCPNLTTLVLSGLHRYTFKPGHRFVGIQIRCSSQIKMLSIMQYQGSANELKHIRHLLLKMECLQVVKVYVSPAVDDPKKMQLTDDLLKLSTASYKVKIQVM